MCSQHTAGVALDSSSSASALACVQADLRFSWLQVWCAVLLQAKAIMHVAASPCAALNNTAEVQKA